MLGGAKSLILVSLVLTPNNKQINISSLLPSSFSFLIEINWLVSADGEFRPLSTELDILEKVKFIELSKVSAFYPTLFYSEVVFFSASTFSYSSIVFVLLSKLINFFSSAAFCKLL